MTMTVWKKALAAIGIGGAKISLELASPYLTAGGTADVIVRLRGGAVGQTINDCLIELLASYTGYTVNAQGEQRATTREALLQSYTVPVGGPLRPQEVREIPLVLAIPLHVPPRLHRESVWFRTRLDIAHAADSRDRDDVEVLPDPFLQRVLNAMSRLRFHLVRSCLMENGNPDLSPDAYVQRIAYRVPDEYKNDVDEVILTPVWMDEALRLVMQVDRKQGLLRALSGADIATQPIVMRPGEWADRDGEAIASCLHDGFMRAIAQEQ